MSDRTLPIEIVSLPLSARTRNALLNAGFREVAQLASVDRQQLLRARNLGQRSLEEIERVLARLDANLAGPAPAAGAHVLPLAVSDWPIDAFLEVARLPLSYRAQNALTSAGIRRVFDLLRTSPAEVRTRTKNFGRHSITETGALLARLHASFAGWERASHDAGSPFVAAMWAAPMDPAAAEADQAAIAARIVTGAAEIEAATRRVVIGDQAFGEEATVEAECDARWSALLPPGEAAMVRAWIALHKPIAPTLHQVGQAFGVTREWVRQILVRARAALRRTGVSFPRGEAALSRLGTMSACSEEAAAQLLHEEGFSAAHLYPRALQRLSEWTGSDAHFDLCRVGEARLVLPPKQRQGVDSVARHVERIVSHRGCGSLDDLMVALAESGHPLDETAARTIAANLPDVVVLQHEGFWFTLGGNHRNRLVEVLDAVLAVAGSIRLSDFIAAFHRRLEGDRRKGTGHSPPDKVMAACCRHAGDCSVDAAGMIVPRSPRSLDTALNGAERFLVEALRRHGPVLSRSEIASLSARAGAGHQGPHRTLARTAIVRSVGRGRFALIGTQTGPEDVARVDDRMHRLPKRRLAVRSGKSSDGCYAWMLLDLAGRRLQNDIKVPVWLAGDLREGTAFEVVDAPHDEMIGAMIGVNHGRLPGLVRLLRKVVAAGWPHVCVTLSLDDRTAAIDARQQPYTIVGGFDAGDPT